MATLDFVPELGQTPIFGQDFALPDAIGVRTVRVLLTGDNNQVDFQNIGLTGRLSAGNVPALGAPATALLSLALAASAFALRRGRRR